MEEQVSEHNLIYSEHNLIYSASEMLTSSLFVNKEFYIEKNMLLNLTYHVYVSSLQYFANNEDSF